MKQAAENLDFLLVEDNPADSYLIKQMLHSAPISIGTIYEADRLNDACELFDKERIDLALLDLSLPDSFGINSFLGIKEAAKKTPVIILTGLTDTTTALQAIKEGAKDYLIKGEINETLLARAIMYCMERQEQEEKLRASEEKYRQMFDLNPFPSIICDIASMKILEVNNSAIEKYGYSRDEFLKLNLSSLRPPEDVHELLQAIAETDFSKINSKIFRHKKKNGEVMFMESTFYPISYFGKTAIQSQMNDVTKRVELEEELEKQQKLKMIQVTAAALTAQEKERRLLGEELHDNISQVLASVKLFLNVGAKNPERSAEMIERSLDNLGKVTDDIRKLSHTLILPGLKAKGLIISIEELVNDISTASALKVSIEQKNFDESRLSEDQKVAICRIIQEQLNNVLKYAEATEAVILLEENQNKIIFSIADNGKGFDTSAQRKGVGFINVINRVQLYNGNVKIDSAPGRGCKLEVMMDL